MGDILGDRNRHKELYLDPPALPRPRVVPHHSSQGRSGRAWIWSPRGEENSEALALLIWVSLPLPVRRRGLVLSVSQHL